MAHTTIGLATVLAALCFVSGGYLVFDARSGRDATGGVLLVALGIAIAYVS